MTVQEAITNRRSIRAYTPDPVSPEDLRTILEAGRLAPSGCNLQPTRFVVTRNATIKARLANEGTSIPSNRDICNMAPVVITFCGALDSHCDMVERSIIDQKLRNPGVEPDTNVIEMMKSYFDGMSPEALGAYTSLNVAIALTQMNLQAEELGYGMCWMMAIKPDKIAEILNVPSTSRVIAISPLGRPAQTPEATSRRSFDEIIFGDTYGSPLAL